MSTVIRFEDLEVWKHARELCREVFQLTLHEAFSKDFGLKDQISNLMIYLRNSEIKGNKYKSAAQQQKQKEQ